MTQIPTLNVIRVLVAQRRLKQLLEWEEEEASPRALDPYWRAFDEAFHALWLRQLVLHGMDVSAGDDQSA